ncbi:YfiR family protein [Saccharicrinis fermentans]|uniref:DUF4154 domain-containing protein n=1 Tax=Saccharicrinis fermentans DSM 9555 = JCM 21142 TaxID=869213 RepID=W7Y2Z9_9BACT|nr:YfiR family protein [Saccharicrinis fermentans]GAF02372.1 hypothetical protein JCM21142_31006 [Saccharicrinis fermentans DSM 9555 = JCM 21142]
MIKKTLAILLLIGSLLPVNAQNYKFQALFIYNIVKRVNWPPSSDNFKIGVVGSKELQKELEILSKKQKIGGKTIEIITLTPSSIQENEVHVLYLGRSSSSKIGDIQTIIKSKPVLLIGDKAGLKGAGINFIDNSKEIKFEIYPNTIKEHQLAISSSLLNLGVVIE